MATANATLDDAVMQKNGLSPTGFVAGIAPGILRMLPPRIRPLGTLSIMEAIQSSENDYGHRPYFNLGRRTGQAFMVFAYSAEAFGVGLMVYQLMR